MPELLAPADRARLVRVLEQSKSIGLLGPGPVEAHIDHAIRFGSQVATPERGLDLGSGAGVPGLVLAFIFPGSEWVLLDGAVKRTSFLEAAVASLALGDRVSVELGRAEELAHEQRLRSAFDTVTARSFGAPAVTAECGAGFLRTGGRLYVSEPPDQDSGSRWPAAGLGKLGLHLNSESDGVAVLEQATPLPATLPRRVGIPTKRPIF